MEEIACQYPQCIPTLPQWLSLEAQGWILFLLFVAAAILFIMYLLWGDTPGDISV